VASPPTRPALRARYDRRRDDVVASAAAVFAEQGYHATSIADLTDATGLAAGGIYHYIGSKEQLLIAVCDALMDPLLAGATALEAEQLPPEEELRALVGLWVGHVATHRDHMVVFQQERHVIEHERQWRAVRASRKQFERMLDEALARCEREGGVHFADRDLTMRGLLGMVNHLPQWYRPRGRLSPRQIADGFCDIVLAPARDHMRKTP
jgi:AcrR family transcriptional regulator